jgi:CelD/BcsL family acetyltransferase involved in cellulose biosynthesis
LNLPAGALIPEGCQAHAIGGAHPPISEASATDPVAGCTTLNAFMDRLPYRAEWISLAKLAKMPTQAPDFVSAVAKHLSQGQRVQIHHVTQGQRLTALFPLATTNGPFGRLTLVGENELGEPGDALCVDREGARLIAETIMAERKVVDLDRLPADSPLIAAFTEASRGRARLLIRPGKGTPVIDLDPNWSEPIAKFNSRRRSDFRRAARKAAEAGAVMYEVLSPGLDEFDRLFDLAIEVEARSWKKGAGAAAERGELRLALMRIDGKVVAMQLALESLGRFWLFKIGFDEAYGRCSPGTLLMLHSIGWAARRGLKSYEFLGNVEPWIAQLWTRDSREYVRVRLYPYNAHGAVALAMDGLAWARARLARFRSG